MRRFFTFKRLAVVAVLLLMLLVAAPLGYLAADRWQSQGALGETTRSLDRQDPDWRLDDIVRVTNAKLPPDDRNSFVLATAANELLPADCQKRFLDFPDWSKSPPNVLLDAAVKAKLLAALRGMEPATDLARDLADLPDAGGNVIVMTPNPMDRLMQKEQDLRLTVALLRADATLLAEDGKMGEAVRSVRAALGTARALGDDPSMVGQLVRIALGAISARAAESVLNLGEPDAGLAELQAEFLRESVAPKLLVGLRGERSSADRVMGEALPPRLYGRSDRAACVDMLTHLVEAAKLPPEHRAAALRAVPCPRDGDPRYLLTILIRASIDKAIDAALRNQGELAAVAVGVACERHRRKFGHWPAALADIPKDILPAVPTDPGDGLPIKYQRLADRVVVYSVGPDGIDHGSDLNESTPRDKRDYGIRLYDVPLRRQPAPPPPVPEPEPPAPGDAP